LIAEEATAVASALKSPHLFVGDAATHEILRERGPASRVIHLATHGDFRQVHSMFSGVRLGPSFLSLADLYHLQLPAELITLTGCAPGLNTVVTGDEFLGLTHALLAGGAQSLLRTFWEVPDHSAIEFMTGFYSGLNKGQSKPQALQSATMDIRGRYFHPYYWAPYFLAGKASPS